MRYYIGNLLVTVYSWEEYVKLKKQKYEKQASHERKP